MSSKEMRKLMNLMESTEKLDEFSLSGLKDKIKQAAGNLMGRGKESEPVTPAPSKTIDAPKDAASPMAAQPAQHQAPEEKPAVSPAVSPDYDEMEIRAACKDAKTFAAKAAGNALLYDGEVIKYDSSYGFDPVYLGSLYKKAISKIKSGSFSYIMQVPNVDAKYGKITENFTFKGTALSTLRNVVPVYCSDKNSFGLFIQASLDTTDFSSMYDKVFLAKNKVAYDETNEEHLSAKTFAESFVKDSGRVGLTFIELKYDGEIGVWHHRTMKGGPSVLRAMVKGAANNFIVKQSAELESIYSLRSTVNV